MTTSLQRDANFVAVAGGVYDDSSGTIAPLSINATTGRLKVSAIISGGLTGYQQPLTGALNQATFTWKTAPNVIVVDGVPKQKVQTDGTVNWTGTTTTVLSVWPTFDIFSTS